MTDSNPTRDYEKLGRELMRAVTEGLTKEESAKGMKNLTALRKLVLEKLAQARVSGASELAKRVTAMRGNIEATGTNGLWFNALDSALTQYRKEAGAKLDAPAPPKPDELKDSPRAGLKDELPNNWGL